MRNGAASTGGNSIILSVVSLKKIKMIQEEENCPAKERQEGKECSSRSPKTITDSMSDELQVDKTLLLYKAFYFLFFAGFGASFPYMSLYFKQIGLNASSVGILAGIRPIIQFISGPFWAILADRFKARKAVFLFSIFSWLVMTVALLIPTPHKTQCRNLMANVNSTQKHLTVLRRQHSTQPAIDKRREQNIAVPVLDESMKDYGSAKGQQNTFSFFRNSPFQVYFLKTSNKEPEYAVRTSSNTYELVYDENEIYQVFIYLLILVVSGEFLEAPTFIMADTALLQKLGEKRRNYGKTRLFGSLGFAFGSLVVGGLLDSTEYTFCGQVMNNYSVLFYSFAIVMAIAFVFGAWMFEFTYDEVENSKTGENNGSTSTMEILTLLLKFQYAFFLLISFFLGFSNGLFFNFLNWYLEDLGASKLLMGIATIFRAIALIIAFIFNAFLSDLCGRVQLMLFSVAGYFILFGGFSVIQNPWWALPLEFLEGVTYGTTWSTAVTHLADATPKGGAATMQG